MKRASGGIAITLSLLLLQGCSSQPATAANSPVVAAPPAPSPARAPETAIAAAPSNATSSSAASDEVIAKVAGRPIVMGQLMKPLIEAHGLTVLLNLVQLELAKQAAVQAHITVTDDDIQQERKRTMDRLFLESDQKMQDRIDSAAARNKPDEVAKLKLEMEKDHESLLKQFLENQKVTATEFELVLQTNAYLRKLAEPRVAGMITDNDLRKSFEAEYGASVRVRHIQGSPLDLAQASERLRKGEAFEVVARQMSKHPTTAPLGGELPRFSLASPGLPANFKQAAFDLQVGEVSNMVEAEGSFHLIKLEEKFSPKAVKFENVKEIIREKMQERVIEAAVKELRDLFAKAARNDLKIEQPVLKAQFDARLAERDRQIKDQKKAREQLEKDQLDARSRQEPFDVPEGPVAPKPSPAGIYSPEDEPAPAAPGTAPAAPAADKAQATKPAQAPASTPAVR